MDFLFALKWDTGYFIPSVVMSIQYTVIHSFSDSNTKGRKVFISGALKGDCDATSERSHYLPVYPPSLELV